MTTLLLAAILSLAPVNTAWENTKSAWNSNWLVTGYTTADDETSPWADGLTADGTVAEVGVDAACPPHIPLGATLYVEGIGVRTCSDRGGAIKGSRLDVLVETKEQAYEITGQRRVLILTQPGGRK